MRVLTGPDGMSRDVGEDTDDAKVRQLRDRALWGQAGLFVPDKAWPGTAETWRPLEQDSTCSPTFLPQGGATFVGLKGSVSKRGRMRTVTPSMWFTEGSPKPSLDESGRRSPHPVFLRPAQISAHSLS